MKNILLFFIFAGFLFPDHSAFAAGINNTCTWTGIASTSWDTPSNWQNNSIPAAGDDAIIPASCQYYPVLPYGSTTTCHSLTVNSSGLVRTPLSYGMTINGTMIVNGTMLISAAGSVNIAAGGAMTVAGDLTISGTLLVETRASLITSGTVTGNATIERFMEPDLNWHLLSSPVTYQEICNGSFAPTLASFPGNITSWDFYGWSSDCSNHWRNLRNSNGTPNTVYFGSPPAFTVGKGYLVAYSSGFPATKQFTGTPNTGDQLLSFQDATEGCSWELEGNPFPSAVDWSKVIGRENLAWDYYYVYNPLKAGGEGYEYWKDSIHYSSSAVDGNIPSMQGFFVKADPAGAKTLQILNSARLHDVYADTWLKEIARNMLLIRFGNNSYYDEAKVMFENGSSPGPDWNDAEKLFSLSFQIPHVYTLADSIKCCFDSYPYTSGDALIPIGIVPPSSGSYMLSFSGIESFSTLTCLILEDLLLGTTQDLLDNPDYSFTAEGYEDATRFVLHFCHVVEVGNHRNADPISIHSSGNVVYIDMQENHQPVCVEIYDLLGNKMLNCQLGESTRNGIRIDSPAGCYIVKAKYGDTQKVSKVFIRVP
jgi:hypothetical protein